MTFGIFGGKWKKGGSQNEARKAMTPGPLVQRTGTETREQKAMGVLGQGGAQSAGGSCAVWLGEKEGGTGGAQRVFPLWFFFFFFCLFPKLLPPPASSVVLEVATPVPGPHP